MIADCLVNYLSCRLLCHCNLPATATLSQDGRLYYLCPQNVCVFFHLIDQPNYAIQPNPPTPTNYTIPSPTHYMAPLATSRRALTVETKAKNTSPRDNSDWGVRCVPDQKTRDAMVKRSVWVGNLTMGAGPTELKTALEEVVHEDISFSSFSFFLLPLPFLSVFLFFPFFPLAFLISPLRSLRKKKRNSDGAWLSGIHLALAERGHWQDRPWHAVRGIST